MFEPILRISVAYSSRLRPSPRRRSRRAHLQQETTADCQQHHCLHAIHRLQSDFIPSRRSSRSISSCGGGATAAGVLLVLLLPLMLAGSPECVDLTREVDFGGSELASTSVPVISVAISRYRSKIGISAGEHTKFYLDALAITRTHGSLSVQNA